MARLPRGAQQTYRATLAYDGRGFAGWARQPSEDTVEAAVREALTEVLGEPPSIAVAGRTDRGVSATGQVISFRGPPGIDPRAIVAAIDQARPDRLACLEARPEVRRFHAQYTAIARRYVYRMPRPAGLDVARVDRQLCAILGRRDFTAFGRDTPGGQSTIRAMREAKARIVFEADQPILRVDLCADAFLRRMVRVLVATAIREAQAHAPDDALLQILREEDRQRTAHPLPPEGLTLVRVIY